MSGAKIRNMEEFAEKCGISRPTLSKYFYSPESVRPTTRARIEEALTRYDYRPNIYAINQNRRLTKTIGIVVPYLADPFFAEIVRVIENKCIDAGYSPSLFSSHGEQKQENDTLDGLRSLKPAGVLLAPLGRRSDKAAIEAFSREVPTVLFDCDIDGLGQPFAGSDNAQFTSQMVRYLCRTGSPPCFFEMKSPPNPNTRKRREGYIAAMKASGEEPHIVQVDGEGWALEEIGCREGIRALKEGRFATNTVLCSNDRLAIGFLAACYERGLRVGIKEDCDIRVAGLDGHPLSQFTCPPLTTVSHDYEAISSHAVNALFTMIDTQEHDEPLVEKLFEGRLLMRFSA